MRHALVCVAMVQVLRTDEHDDDARAVKLTYRDEAVSAAGRTAGLAAEGQAG